MAQHASGDPRCAPTASPRLTGRTVLGEEVGGIEQGRGDELSSALGNTPTASQPLPANGQPGTETSAALPDRRRQTAGTPRRIARRPAR